MKRRLSLSPFAALAALAALVFACSASPGAPSSAGPSEPAAREAVRGYATIAQQNYADAVTQAEALKAAVDAFVASPSQASLEAARRAYVEARVPYERTEALRFYGGPIDGGQAGDPEGRINGWPLDENFIDYTKDEPDAGIINRPAEFAQIDKALIVKRNGDGGEKNLSAGFHAIEFLLWGQDFNPGGPGDRPFTDYVVGAGATAKHQDRRRAYLQAVTALLVDDLTSVAVQWRLESPDTYGARFVADDPKVSLTKILKGIGNLASGELARERMNNAYATKDQEEEHSCFSDTTVPVDLPESVVGIQNLYLGTYGALKVPGLDALVRASDPAVADKLKLDIEATLAAMRAIPAPFDQAILGPDDTPGRKALLAAINATKRLAATVALAAEALGLKLDFDYCSDDQTNCGPK